MKMFWLLRLLCSISCENPCKVELVTSHSVVYIGRTDSTVISCNLNCPLRNDVTDIRWYDNHHRPISIDPSRRISMSYRGSQGSELRIRTSGKEDKRTYTCFGHVKNQTLTKTVTVVTRDDADVASGKFLSKNRRRRRSTNISEDKAVKDVSGSGEIDASGEFTRKGNEESVANRNFSGEEINSGNIPTGETFTDLTESTTSAHPEIKITTETIEPEFATSTPATPETFELKYGVLMFFLSLSVVFVPVLSLALPLVLTGCCRRKNAEERNIEVLTQKHLKATSGVPRFVVVDVDPQTDGNTSELAAKIPAEFGTIQQGAETRLELPKPVETEKKRSFKTFFGSLSTRFRGKQEETKTGRDQTSKTHDVRLRVETEDIVFGLESFPVARPVSNAVKKSDDAEDAGKETTAETDKASEKNAGTGDERKDSAADDTNLTNPTEDESKRSRADDTDQTVFTSSQQSEDSADDTKQTEGTEVKDEAGLVNKTLPERSENAFSSYEFMRDLNNYMAELEREFSPEAKTDLSELNTKSDETETTERHFNFENLEITIL